MSYPTIGVHGFDLDPDAIEAARDHAEASGVADRVTFSVTDVAETATQDRFDLVTLFEALHDMTRPMCCARPGRCWARMARS